MTNDTDYFLECFPIIIKYLSNNDLVQLSSMNKTWKQFLNEFRTVRWITNKSEELLILKEHEIEDNQIQKTDDEIKAIKQMWGPNDKFSQLSVFLTHSFKIDYRPKWLRTFCFSPWYLGKKYTNPSLENIVNFIKLIENSTRIEIKNWLRNKTITNRITKWCEIHNF